MTIRERLSRLADEDFLFSEAHQALLWSGQGVGNADTREFVKAFIRDAARLKIPLYAVRLSATTAEIIHAQWRYSLPADDWAILAYIGRRAAARVGVSALWATEASDEALSALGVDADRLAVAGDPVYDPALWYFPVPTGKEVLSV